MADIDGDVIYATNQEMFQINTLRH